MRIHLPCSNIRVGSGLHTHTTPFVHGRRSWKNLMMSCQSSELQPGIASGGEENEVQS